MDHKKNNLKKQMGQIITQYIRECILIEDLRNDSTFLIDACENELNIISSNDCFIDQIDVEVPLNDCSKNQTNSTVIQLNDNTCEVNKTKITYIANNSSEQHHLTCDAINDDKMIKEQKNISSSMFKKDRVMLTDKFKNNDFINKSYYDFTVTIKGHIPDENNFSNIVHIGECLNTNSVPEIQSDIIDENINIKLNFNEKNNNVSKNNSNTVVVQPLIHNTGMSDTINFNTSDNPVDTNENTTLKPNPDEDILIIYTSDIEDDNITNKKSKESNYDADQTIMPLIPTQNISKEINFFPSIVSTPNVKMNYPFRYNASRTIDDINETIVPNSEVQNDINIVIPNDACQKSDLFSFINACQSFRLKDNAISDCIQANNLFVANLNDVPADQLAFQNDKPVNKTLVPSSDQVLTRVDIPNSVEVPSSVDIPNSVHVRNSVEVPSSVDIPNSVGVPNSVDVPCSIIIKSEINSENLIHSDSNELFGSKKEQINVESKSCNRIAGIINNEIVTEVVVHCKPNDDEFANNQNEQKGLKRHAPELSNIDKKAKLDGSCLADDSQADETMLNFTQLIFDSQKTFDQNNPLWQDVNVLSTAEEYFNFVSKLWQSERLPNPHENLTKRFMLKPPAKIKNKKQKKSKQNPVPVAQYYTDKVNTLSDKMNVLQRNGKNNGKLNQLSIDIDKLRNENRAQFVINKFYSNKNTGLNALYVSSRQFEDMQQQDKMFERMKISY